MSTIALEEDIMPELLSLAGAMEDGLWRAVHTTIDCPSTATSSKSNSTLRSASEWEFHLDLLPAQLVGAPSPSTLGLVVVEPTPAPSSYMLPHTASNPRQSAVVSPVWHSLAVCIFKEAIPSIALVMAGQLASTMIRGAKITSVSNLQPSAEAATSSKHMLLTLILLCLSPMQYSVWNDRKRWLVQAQSGAAHSQEGTAELYRQTLFEYYFTSLILSKFPKVPEVSAHRLWVAQLMIDICKRPSSLASMKTGLFIEQILTSPTAIRSIFSAADKHHRNYPLWFSFVLPCVRYMLKSARDVEAQQTEGVLAFVQSVISFYLPRHPTDHSAVQCIWTLLKDMSATSCEEAPPETVAMAQQDTFEILLALNTKTLFRDTAQYTLRLLNSKEQSSVAMSNTQLGQTKMKKACHSDEGEEGLLSDSSFGAVLPITEGSWQVRKMLVTWYLCEWGRRKIVCPPTRGGHSIPSIDAEYGLRSDVAISYQQKVFTAFQMSFIANELALVLGFLEDCDGPEAPWPVCYYALTYGLFLCEMSAVGR